MPRPLRTVLASLAALAAALIQAPAFAAAPDRSVFIELGALGPRGSVALTVNNRGDVGGYSAWEPPGEPGNWYFHPFLWRNGTMTDLGTHLGNPPGRSFNQASVINDQGIAVVTGYEGVHLWRDGTLTSLGFRASANDINRSGDFVGAISTGNGTAPYVYRDGSVRPLPTEGGVLSGANAINGKGVIVGVTHRPDTFTTRGFIYRDGAMTMLGTLGGQGSTATDVNNRGVVVGHAQDAAGVWKAFIDDGAGMRMLSNLPAGNSNAVAIDDRGVVLVESDHGAFLWDAGEIRWLADFAAVKAAGWARLFPIDMNDRGDIVGWGWKPGDGAEHGFLLRTR